MLKINIKINESKIYSLLIVAIFITSCNKNKCKKDDTEKWIIDAPVALREFYEVKKEVFANENFVKKFSYNGELFLKSNEVFEYKKYPSTTSLIKWFENGRGYISIANDKIKFSFKECVNGGDITSGIIYYNTKINFNYKPSVEIIDTMNLGNSWFAVVSRCKGCTN
jgi:hypothetical protein